MNYAYSFLKKAIYIEKNNTDLPWILNGIKYRERYSRDLDFNKYEETLDQYKWVLKDADNATRIYTLALLKKEFHKTEEAVQDIKEYLENYKDNASESIAIKESMQYLLVNIFSERGNWNKEEKQISKVLQKYSGKDNYEDRFLNEQRHQENINTLEYQIFLETYFGDALSESSVERIAYQETVGQTKEAIIYIVYEIELLEGKIKTCRESERLSISLFLAFLNQRLFLLTKHDNFNEQALFTFIDETYDTFTYSRFDTKHDEPLYKRIITKINEAEQKWKKYFLELTAKNPEEFFNFQKEQLLIHEEMSKRTQEAENKLRFKFPKFDSLDAESRKLLITGEYIYKNLDASPKDSDYSSVVAQYSRAIENELGKKLGLKGMLGNKQNQLIDGILKINKPDSNLLKYIDKNELLEWDIFSEKYLGYSLNSNKNLNRDDYLWKDKNTFFEKIRNPRNAVSHSGEDSFFERARADKVIKDMTDFLLQWTEVNFEDQRIQLHQSKS
jgi:hypothetical protein